VQYENGRKENEGEKRKRLRKWIWGRGNQKKRWKERE